jgi:SAM-dependent methyltransferase
VVDKKTIEYYESNAPSICARYESGRPRELQDFILQALRGYTTRRGIDRPRILEIGCGSGRETAFLFEQGYEAFGVDASNAMIACARSHHPETADRLFPAAFPLERSPEHVQTVLQLPFDAILLLATAMHIPDNELETILNQVHAMLVPSGIMIISSSSGRSGIKNDRDPNGRLFIERTSETLTALLQKHRFRILATRQDEDSLSRDITWNEFVCEKIGE